MRAWLASWRVAIRHGRRDMVKQRGRAALVAIMVGAPVLLTTMLLVVTATNDVSPRESITGQLGSAQAALQDIGSPLTQSPDGDNVESQDIVDEPRSAAESQRRLERLLGDPVATVSSTNTSISRDGRGYAAEVRGIDTASPLTRGMFTVQSGRAPRADDEVLVNPVLADRGMTVGRRVDVGGRAMTVVGVGQPDASVRGGNDPGAVTLTTDGVPSWLVGGAPIGWDRVKELNAAGVQVVSRAVLEDPPPASEVAASGTQEGGAERAVFVIIATSVLLEIVLLASPAFAVSVRRQRRELALMAATGASPRQLRRIVLGQALVLGVATSVAGAALGIGAGALVTRFGPDVVRPLEVGPFQVQWVPVVVATLLGAAAAMAAAYLPARQASRQDVATVLAGRRGQVRTARGWPLAGALLVVAGVAACFTLGIRAGGELIVATSTIAIVLGAVLLMPTVVGLAGRLAGRLPLPFRLALRDASRQRSRSAPAIAAIMASVAGITAVGIGATSQFADSEKDYRTEAAIGRTQVIGDPDTMPALLSLVRRTTGHDYLPMTSGRSDDTITTSAAIADEEAGQGNALVTVATPAELRAWGVPLSRSSADALERGAAIVDPSQSPTRRAATLIVTNGEGKVVRQADVPLRSTTLAWGSSADAGRLDGIVVSPRTADRLDFPTEVRRAVSPADAPTLTKAQTDALDERLTALGLSAGASTERGFERSWDVLLVALFAAGGAAVLIATWTATALALSDARPDLATLSAVGAAPRTRRWMAGAQAGVLAVLGALVGVAVGFAPGLAITWPLTATDYLLDGSSQAASPTIDVPWTMLLVLVVAVPLLAAAVAVLVVRGRLPLVRRLAQ